MGVHHHHHHQHHQHLGSRTRARCRARCLDFMNPIWAHGVTVAVQGHMEEASRWMMADPTKAQMHVQTAQSIQNTTMGMVNYLLVQQAQSSMARAAPQGFSSPSVPFHGQSSHLAPSFSSDAFDPWGQATWRREVQMPCDDASLQVPAAAVDDPQPAMLPQNDADPDEDGCIETPIPPRPPDHPQPAIETPLQPRPPDHPQPAIETPLRPRPPDHPPPLKLLEYPTDDEDETPIPPRPPDHPQPAIVTPMQPRQPDHPPPATMLPENDAYPTDDEFDEIPMPPRPPDGYVAPICDEPNCNNISAWECSTKKCKRHCGVTSNP